MFNLKNHHLRLFCLCSQTESSIVLAPFLKLFSRKEMDYGHVYRKLKIPDLVLCMYKGSTLKVCIFVTLCSGSEFSLKACIWNVPPKW